MTDFTLEIPIDSIEVARKALPLLRTGDRLELCEDLASEGWTPRMVLVESVRAEAAPGIGIVAMIRPKIAGVPGTLDVAGFAATAEVIDASIREIESAAAAGATSVAIGLLTADGRVDRAACRRLVEAAEDRGLEVAFLRTIDLVVDRGAAVRAIDELGCVRVVTAGVLGWDASVADVATRTQALSTDAAVAASIVSDGRSPLEIVSGGGVRASNAEAFATVSPHLHASCRRDGVFAIEELIALNTVRGV